MNFKTSVVRVGNENCYVSKGKKSFEWEKEVEQESREKVRGLRKKTFQVL